MKHLTFNGVGGTGMVNAVGIINSDITVEGSGIWQFEVNIQPSPHATQLLLFDTTKSYSIPKYKIDGYYKYDYNNSDKILSCIQFDNYSFVFTDYDAKGTRTVVFDFTSNLLSVYNQGVFVASGSLSLLSGKDIQFVYQTSRSYERESIPTKTYIQFNDGSPEYPITYPIPGIPTLYDHINTIRCYSYKDKNGFIYGYK